VARGRLLCACAARRGRRSSSSSSSTGTGDGAAGEAPTNGGHSRGFERGKGGAETAGGTRTQASSAASASPPVEATTARASPPSLGRWSREVARERGDELAVSLTATEAAAAAAVTRRARAKRRKVAGAASKSKGKPSPYGARVIAEHGDIYVRKELRPAEKAGYKSAGILMYHIGDSHPFEGHHKGPLAGVSLLVAKQVRQIAMSVFRCVSRASGEATAPLTGAQKVS
jgi:hypothetical protein